MARSMRSPISRGLLRLLLLSAVFLSLVLVPTVLVAGLIAWWQTTGATTANLSIGLVCSLIAWLFIAVFHLRREAVAVSVPDRKAFLQKTRTLLDGMGYDITAQSPNLLVAQPRFNAFLFGGGLRIMLSGAQATIVGPKISTELLRRRLRMEHHLFRVHASLLGERKNTETLLKRVEIRLRVKPEQLAALQTKVIAPLQESADVLCELNLLIQSEQGIRESTIEQHVRPWALGNALPCEIHKHHAKYYESLLRPRVATEVPA
jgi:hypothetical protein